jgi:hypothetical protein
MIQIGLVGFRQAKMYFFAVKQKSKVSTLILRENNRVSLATDWPGEYHLAFFSYSQLALCSRRERKRIRSARTFNIHVIDASFDLGHRNRLHQAHRFFGLRGRFPDGLRDWASMLDCYGLRHW